MYFGVSGFVDCVVFKRFLLIFWRIFFLFIILIVVDCIGKLLFDILIEFCLDDGIEDLIRMFMFWGVKFCEGLRFFEDIKLLLRFWLFDGFVVFIVMVEDFIVMCFLFEMEDVIFG